MFVEQVTQEVLLKLFFIAIVVDFVTGILASAKEGRLKSRTCSNGMFRSMGEGITLILLMTIPCLIKLKIKTIQIREIDKLFMVIFLFIK